MKYLVFIRHPESYRHAGVPDALMQAMGAHIEQAMAKGILVDTGGLRSTEEGARVRLGGGKISVTDGPFTEAKEVIGGWAILNASTKQEAIGFATEFMDLHRTHWPAFEGECGVRAMFEPGEGP